MKEYTNYKALNAIKFRDDIIITDGSTKSVIRASDSLVLISEIRFPLGLAATNDDLWVGDREAGKVIQVIDNGELLPEPIIIADSLSFPEGLALLSNNSLLVVESGIGRLSSINFETGKVSVVTDGLKLDISDPTDQGVSSMKLFNGVAVGPSGFIYITGDGANVLYRIDPK